MHGQHSDIDFQMIEVNVRLAAVHGETHFVTAWINVYPCRTVVQLTSKTRPATSCLQPGSGAAKRSFRGNRPRSMTVIGSRLRCSPFEVNGADRTQGGAPAFRIVEAFEEFEGRHLWCRANVVKHDHQQIP